MIINANADFAGYDLIQIKNLPAAVDHATNEIKTVATDARLTTFNSLTCSSTNPQSLSRDTTLGSSSFQTNQQLHRPSRIKKRVIITWQFIAVSEGH